jgi:hypothetical protein
VDGGAPDGSAGDKVLYVLWTLHIEGDTQDAKLGDPSCNEHEAFYQKQVFEQLDVAGLEEIWRAAKGHLDAFGRPPRMHISPAGEFFETELDGTYGRKAFRKFVWSEAGHEVGIQGHRISHQGRFCWPTREPSEAGIRSKLGTLHAEAERWVHDGKKVNDGFTYSPGVKLDVGIFGNDRAATEKFLDLEAAKLGYRVAFEDWDGCIEDSPSPGKRPPYLHRAEYPDGTRMYKVCFQGAVVPACKDAPRCESPDTARQWIDSLVGKLSADPDPRHLYYFAFATHACAGVESPRPGSCPAETAGMTAVLEHLDQKVRAGVRVRYVTPRELVEIFEKR